MLKLSYSVTRKSFGTFWVPKTAEVVFEHPVELGARVGSVEPPPSKGNDFIASQVKRKKLATFYNCEWSSILIWIIFLLNFIFVLPDSLLLLPPPVSEVMQFLTMTGRKPW